MSNSKRIGAGTGRLSVNSSSADWVQFAIDRHWPHSSAPTVFISYAGEDLNWVRQLERWLTPELDTAKCPLSGDSYRIGQFAGGHSRTVKGGQFTQMLAREIWDCRAAIVVLSQNYMLSPICRNIELPFLVWRHDAHGIPLYVVHVGLFTDSAAIVSVPQIQGAWPDLDLRQQTNDTHPALNPRLRDPMSGKLLSELNDGPERDQRLKALSGAVRAEIELRKLSATGQSFREAISQLVGAASAVPDVQIGAFPVLDTFEGRAKQLEALSACARGGNVSVAGITEMGGLGKTTLAMKFIDDLKATGGHRFECIFRFTFYGGRTQEEFATALTEFLVHRVNESPFLVGRSRDAWLGDVLRRRPVLLLIDGMEDIQAPDSAGDRGSLQQGPIRRLLLWLCQGRGCASLALLTSRLPFHDLDRFRGARFMPIDLAGLDVEEGVLVLKQWGVDDDDEALARYVKDLSGHPLGLRAFANGVRGLGNEHDSAAAVVAREAGLAEPGTVEDKLRRVLDYYKAQLSPLDAAVVATVSVFTDGASADWVARTMERETPELLSQAGGGLSVQQRLDHLTQGGILQVKQGRDRRMYTAHPIIRQHFRPKGQSLADAAASLQIADRPPDFIPHTLEQVRPYLAAIATYAESGDFKGANRILGRKLGFGDLLEELNGWREQFNCLMQFLHPEREEACLSALGPSWFNAMLPRMISVCITLNEWHFAEYFLERDTAFLRAEHPSDAVLNRIARARVATEVGSIGEAAALLGAVVNRRETPQWPSLLPELAEIERYRGRSRRALAIVRDWRIYRPRGAEFFAWLSGWDEALVTSAKILFRSQPDVAHKLASAINRTLPVPADRRQRIAAIHEYFMLDLRVRSELTRYDWQRLLQLSEELAADSGRLAIKGADAGWSIAVLIALNGLERPEDALEQAAMVMSQLHERSWRRTWVETEMARSYLLFGDLVLARQTAEDARAQAWARGHMLLARGAAELLLEVVAQAPDAVIEARAKETLDWIAEQAPRDEDLPDLAPLPGSPEWDAQVSELLLASIDEGTTSELDPNGTVGRALAQAADLGLSGAIEKLLGRNADPRQTDNNNLTPLARAVRAGHQRAVELLLAAQGRIDLSNPSDQRVVAVAIERGRPAIVEQLLTDTNGMTDDIRRQIVGTAAQSGDEAMLRAALTGCGDAAMIAALRSTAALVAAAAGNLALLAQLPATVPLSTITDGNGPTPLMAAAMGGHAQVIDFLADHHVDPTPRDKAGLTALDHAADSGRAVALTRLANRFGLPLERRRHQVRALVNATRAGSEFEVEHALHFGVRPDEHDDRGWCALVAAARLPSDAFLRRYLEMLPPGSVNVTDEDGETPLMAAAERDVEASLVLLLKEHASAELADRRGMTAFDRALTNGRAGALITLLQHTGRYVGRARASLPAALKAGHQETLAPVLDNPRLAAMIGAAFAPQLADEADLHEFLRTVVGAFSRTQAETLSSWPSRHPSTLSEADATSQPCVVGATSAATFGRLPKLPAPSEVATRFVQLAKTVDEQLTAYHPEHLRAAALPFLPGQWLVLLPHAEAGIEVPFVLSATGLTLVRRQNEWLYTAINAAAPPATPDVLIAFTKFFLSVVTADLGAFFLIEQEAEALWQDDAPEDVKGALAGHLLPLEYRGIAGDGCHELRGTVLFKNALFETSVMIASSWVMSLENETLLMEELPIHFGEQVSLVVRY